MASSPIMLSAITDVPPAIRRYVTSEACPCALLPVQVPTIDLKRSRAFCASDCADMETEAKIVSNSAPVLTNFMMCSPENSSEIRGPSVSPGQPQVVVFAIIKGLTMPSGTSHNAVDVSSAQDFRAVQTPDVRRLRDEFHALTSTCGVFDLSTRAKVTITGNDRVRWLNGMVTNNIRDLQPAQGIYS